MSTPRPSSTEQSSPSDTAPEPYRAATGRGGASGTHGHGSERNHSHSLRSKLVLSLAFMLTVVVGIDEIVRQTVIVPEFADLERTAALKDTDRVLSAINAETDYLAETATHDALKLKIPALDPDNGQTASTSQTLQERSASEILSTDVPGDGRIQWSAIIGNERPWQWLRLPQSSNLPAFPDLLEAIRGDSPVARHGITLSSDGELYLFAAVPLSDEGDDGDAAAQHEELFYVVGHRFDDTIARDLEKRTCVPFSIEPIRGDQSPRGRIQIRSESDSHLLVHAPVFTPAGQPIAQLNVRLPRDVTSRSNHTTAFARYLSLCGASVSLLLLLLMLQRLVIGRLESIREQTERIAESGILSEDATTPVLRDAGDDEIGQLARSFDRMRVRLSDAQRRLSDASHAAGMSLVADTVIHNVGNVLTNVNSLIETASERIEKLRIEPLDKLATRLRDEEIDDALREATPDYLQRLSETLRDDKDELAGLLHTLADNVQHIHQVIRDQRRHTGQPIKWTPVHITGIIDEAIRCCRARLEQDKVSVEFRDRVDATVWTDRSLVLQVLINIISNAGNATRGVSDRPPKLTITVEEINQQVMIRLEDNGCGMDPATLSRVFDAHFTTRSSGSGLGLHFCAIAIKRIKGSIRAESDGPNRGASFTIGLPLAKPVNEPATEEAELSSS